MNASKINYIVVLCSHNGGHHIFEQVISIAKQSVPVQRICVYDYNSTDNTIDEIYRAKAYCEDQNIDLFIDVNVFSRAPGVNESFISALQLVSKIIKPEDWLYVCDQDDIWKPEKHREVLRYIQCQKDTRTAILFHHDVEVVDSNLKNLQPSYYEGMQLLLLNIFRKPARYYGLVIGHTICMNSYAVDVLSKLGYHESIFMYDWYWGGVIEAIGKRIFIPEKLSMYRQHSNNSVGARLQKKSLNQRVRGTIRTTLGAIHQCSLLDREVARLPHISSREVNVHGKKNENEIKKITPTLVSLKSLIKPLAMKLIIDIVVTLKKFWKNLLICFPKIY